MAFQEKSAWIMCIALIAVGAFYFSFVAVLASESGELAPPPMMPLLIAYTAGLVVLAVAGHIVIAILSPKEADGRLDERERQIASRAGHYSSHVFGVGVVLSLGLYLVSYDGNLLFYAVFASLMVAQVMEYAFQILFFRTSV